VESLSGEGWQPSATEPSETTTEHAESEDFELPPTPSAPEPERKPKAEPETFAGDDDVATEPTVAQRRPRSAGTETTPGELSETPARNSGLSPTPGNERKTAGAAPATPQELIQTGVSFFAGLAQTLSSPEKTQELVQSIVATDETTGQTYLKIPVENAAVVENAVKLLGGLLAGLGR